TIDDSTQFQLAIRRKLLLLLLLLVRPLATSTLFPYTTLFRSLCVVPRRDFDFVAALAQQLDQRLEHQHVRRRGEVDPDPHKRSRSEEHTSELQSPYDLVCRLLLEKKNKSDVVKCSKTLRLHC